MNPRKLFYDRMKSSWLAAMRIIRTVASGGGTPLFVGIFFLVLYFAYEQFLIWLPPDFPIELFLTIPYALLVTSSRIRTWVQPADPVFLLPHETKMKPYFQAGIFYSAIIHLVHLWVFTLLVYPIYLTVWKSHLFFFASFVFFAVIQLANILTEWWQMRLTVVHSVSQIRLLTGCRFLLNLGAAYAFLNQEGILASVMVVALFALAGAVCKLAPVIPYPWQLMQKAEESIVARYHSLASMFMDMPRIKTPVKKRTWLIRLLPRRSRQKPSTYLYWRTFVRKSELFSIQLRLMVWAMILIGIFPDRQVTLAVYAASIFMFAKQLPALVHPRNYPSIHKLYPVSSKERAKSLAFIGLVNLIIQTGWIACFAWGIKAFSTMEFFSFILIGSLVSLAVSYLYLPRRAQHLLNPH